jgi:hypothetical protein
MLVSNIAIMPLQHGGIYECCCFDRGPDCFISTLFDFLMEQSYCSDVFVVMFHTVYFYFSWFGFLSFMGLSTFRVSTSGFVRHVSDGN